MNMTAFAMNMAATALAAKTGATKFKGTGLSFSGHSIQPSDRNKDVLTASFPM
jgi:hypothetical protein